MRVSSHNEVKFWNGFGNCFIDLIARMAKSNDNLHTLRFQLFHLFFYFGNLIFELDFCWGSCKQ